MKRIVDVCDRCGKKVVKTCDSDSSDMVRTNNSFLYLCDLKEGESSRPTLQLKNYYYEEGSYCLDCLLTEVEEWVKKMKDRGASKIPLEKIIFGNTVSSPCPVCGR